VGLAAGCLEYQLRRQNDRREIRLSPEARRLPGPGLLKAWVKGDSSGNRLVFIIAHAKAVAAAEGMRYEEVQELRLPPVVLNFAEWREIALDASPLPKDRYLYWAGLAVEESGQPQPRLTGRIWIDDLRLFPSDGRPPAAVAALALLGERCRSGAREIPVAVDLRNFSDKSWRARGRFTLVDRNEALVASRDIAFEVAAFASREEKIALAGEDPTAFLPPFHLTADILAPEAPEAACQLSTAVVVGNSYLLFEAFADAEANWRTRGVWGEHGLSRETQSECYRFIAAPQDAIRLTRIAIAPDAQGVAPPGRFGLRLQFQRSGAAFNFRPPAQRYLPGDAFRLGFWLKGDGSGARVFAVVHDFSDMADFWHGGWKRVCAEIPLGALDFEGWRYVEVDLPGNGLGTHQPKG
ncbi:MAG: hypothetical protein N3A66_11185, partial [Planctomycetota bacterium]|nr:hypothetical protein [Planctomycetota bacterium]